MPSSTQTVGHFSQARTDDTQRLIERYLHEERITTDDARLISEFIAERRAAGGISPRRADKLAYTLLGRGISPLPGSSPRTAPYIYIDLLSLIIQGDDDQAEYSRRRRAHGPLYMYSAPEWVHG